jgi:hypothetical protein
VYTREKAHSEGQILDGFGLDPDHLMVRLADPRAHVEMLHDPAIVGSRRHAVRGQRRKDGVVSVDPLAADHLDVVHAEQIVDGSGEPPAAPLQVAHVLLPRIRLRTVARVLLDLLLALTILLRESV